LKLFKTRDFLEQINPKATSWLRTFAWSLLRASS